MSLDERLRWNARYAAGSAPARPARAVTALGRLLPRRGRALDVAGGAGRHAVWLAKRGLRVTVVDVSREGLALARRKARAAGVALRTVERDLDVAGVPRGPWDLILVVRWLQRDVWRRLPRFLAPGGVLAIVHPTRRNLRRHAHPGFRHLLRPGELAGLFTGLRILRSAETWDADGRHEAVLVARRPISPRRPPSSAPPPASPRSRPSPASPRGRSGSRSGSRARRAP